MRFFLLAMCLCTGTAMAQSADTLQVTDLDREQAILHTLIEDLNLTESQIPLVAEVLSTRTGKIQSIRENGESDQVKIEQIKTADLEARFALKAILNEEQLDVYISSRRMLKERRQEFGIERNSIDHLVEDF